jgi:hypothetical protein
MQKQDVNTVGGYYVKAGCLLSAVMAQKMIRTFYLGVLSDRQWLQ